MIDDATSRLFARFVRHDSTEENMTLAVERTWSEFGRPLAFYTDKASMFQMAEKRKRQEQREGRDRLEMPPTQIGRALRELGIVWIAAHSPQAKGRVERQFSDGPGSAGERHACGRGEDHRGGQCVPGGRISAVVERGLDGAAGQSPTMPIGRWAKSTIWRRF